MQFANVKEAIPVLKECGSTDKLLMRSAVEDCNLVQTKLATTLAKFWISLEALTAAFDQRK